MSIYEDITVLINQIPSFETEVVYLDGMPEAPTDAISIHVFGGGYQRVHSARFGWSEHGLEVRCRSSEPETARNRLSEILGYLDGQTNLFVNGGLFRSIFAIAPPTITEREVGGVVTYSVSFNVTRRTV